MRVNRYFVFGFLILLVSCNYKKANFSVKTPDGWIKIETIKNGSRHVMMRLPIIDSTPQFVENINIAVVHSMNFDKYISAVISEIKNTSEKFKEEGKGILETKEFDAKWIQFTLKPKESFEQYQQKVYFIADGRNVFMIVCSSVPNGISALQNKIDEVIKSFKIL